MASQMLNEKTFTAEGVQAFGEKAERKSMSVGGVAIKSLFLLVLTVIFASIGWRAAATLRPTSGMWLFLGYILLIGLSLAAAGNPKIAPVAGIFYAVFMGTWMGSISRMYNAYYDGIVGLAVLASVAVFFVCIILYVTGVVKVTARFAGIVIVSTVGLLFAYLIGWVLYLFGVNLFPAGATPLAIGISILICVLAAMNLLLDIGIIAQGVAGNAPKEMEWYCAFGLLATLVWLYLEILRLLALLSGNR